ncbi:transketolase [Candidatus Dependentiae bacterium]
MERKKEIFNIEELQFRAAMLRIDSIRSTTAAGSGHPTSCLSAAEIISSLFFGVMNIDPEKYHSPDTDRFILSKGHAAPVLYAALKQLGVISDEELLQLRDFNSPLEGHPTPLCPMVEFATGSLGQGLAVGVGMAISAKRKGHSFRTYVLTGDGELSEGSNWEAASLASNYQLDNLVAVVDCDRLGQTGESLHGHDIEAFAEKFTAFGWKAFCVNGHDINEILDAFDVAKNNVSCPCVILAKTIKGCGVKSIADKNGFHGKALTEKEAKDGIAEIKRSFAGYGEFEERLGKTEQKTVESQDVKVPEVKIHIDKSPDFEELMSNMSTRKAFGIALKDLGHESENVVVLDGDVGNSTFTNMFEKQFPERFTQSFISEQAMVGMATGMSSRGEIPFAATFGAFLTRAHDQIRMAGVGRNPLRLCGSHAGVSIGQDGPSQMGLEDIAMMRSIPNSIVLYPSDSVSAYKLVEQMVNYNTGISYMRTTRSGTPVLYKATEEFHIGHCKVLRRSESDRIALVGAGITLHEALKAYEALRAEDIDVAVVDLYSVKPIDEEMLAQISASCDGKILTVEDHYPEGGIGEAVKSVLSATGAQVFSLAVNQLPKSGDSKDLMRAAGIDAESICVRVREILNLD